MRLNIRRPENVYFQFAEDLVSESALNRHGFQAAPLFRSARFKAFWSNERRAFDPDFVQAFEERFGLAVP